MTDAIQLDATVREVPTAEWDDYLAARGIDDIYLQRAYVETAALLDDGSPALVSCEGAGGTVVCALVVRPVPEAVEQVVGDQYGELFDAISPYGYGGAVCVGDDPPVAEFQDGFGTWAAFRGVVTTFMRSHPRFDNGSILPRGSEEVALTPTIAWRVGQGRDLMAGMHKKHRSNARRAVREGVEVVVERGAQRFEEFRALYEHTMRRQQASAFYFFSDEYWDALAKLGDRLVMATGWRNGELQAGAMCFDSGDWFHYHLGATADDARRIGASNRVLYEVALHASECGANRFHLGGGVGGGDDSLRNFKLRFDGGGEVPFGIGKCIHNSDIYEAATGSTSTDGFFPAWRAPA